MKLNIKFTALAAVFIAALMLLSPISQTNTSGGGGIGNSDLDFLNSLDINNNHFVLSADSLSDSVDINNVEVVNESETKELQCNDKEVDSTTTFISVKDEQGLNKLSDLVNNDGFDFSGYTIKLTENLTLDDPNLNQSNFTPIGKDEQHKFNGIFDGQGHAISNLLFNITSDSSEVVVGLFGYLGSNATVKDLGIINSSISTTSTGDIAGSGGIAAYNEGTITNCYNTGDVNGSGYSGGIAGYNSGTITNCYNTGIVTGTGDSGGIAGHQGTFTTNEGTISNCYNTGDVTGTENSGGIAGDNYGTIENCYNTGTVEATTNNNAYSGGIAGDNYGTIENCYNTGDVTGSGISGGIAGHQGMFTTNGEIKNCYNTGNVTGSNSGGIIGIYDGLGTAIINSYNTGNVTGTENSGGIIGRSHGTIKNCYNTGNVTGSNSGGIAGDCAAIENCYYLKGCVSNGEDGGKELDRDAMKRLNLLGVGSNNNLNKDKDGKEITDPKLKPWSPDIFNVNDGYPILADVPTQIDPSKSANEPPQSAVYITLDNESAQAENYLERFKLTNVDEVAATINCLNDQNKNITSYQWYTIPEIIQETYYVKVTIDGYSYTSLTRTVSDSFIVMFDNNDGSDVKSIIVSNGKTIAEPENQTKTGYTFEGWYTSDDNGSTLSKKWNFSLDKVTNNMTLYAVWTPIPEPIYTLCLNSNDSTLQTKRYSGTYGTEITLKSASEFGWNSEYKFIEWNSKSDGSGISYKEGDKFSLGSDVWNLYAIWSDSSYHTVSFDSNGGNSIPSQSIQDGYRASEPTDPEKQGYLFKHWSLNGTKYDFNQSVKEDIELKAEYEIISYKVTFYYNGEVYYSTVADYNTSLGDRMPSLPSDKDSWNTSENGKGNNFTADSLITSDISIYAVSESSISSILIIGGSAAAILAAIAAWLFMRSRYN